MSSTKNIPSSVISPQQSATKNVSQQEFAPLIPKGFNGKIILMIVPKHNGVLYHRLTAPLNHLQRNNPDDYFIVEVEDLDYAVATYPDLLENVDVAYFSRTISYFQKIERVVAMLHKFGVRVIVDTDDTWRLDGTHSLFRMWKKGKTADGNFFDTWKQSLVYADDVVVTNEQLKEQCLKLNDNVHIVPNALDTDIKQLKIAKTNDANNKVMFGYLGSPTHERDVKPLGRAFNILYHGNDTKDKFGVVLGGDMREKHGNKDTLGVRAFNNYMKVFNGDSSKIYPNFETFPYMPVESYMTFYNSINVSLIPLAKSEFNMYKSELKMIEAAAMGCLIVVSDVMPYSPFIDENMCVRVGKDKHWPKVMKDIVLNPNEYFPRIIAASNWFNENRTMDVVNEKRKAIIND